MTADACPTALLSALKPHCYGDSDVEPLDAYLPRARQLLPNFPEDVIGQWLYDHYVDAVHQYGWLGFPALTFERACWPSSEILAQVRSWPEDDLTASWTIQLRTDQTFQRSRLGAYMIAHGTWPVPILALANEAATLALPNGVRLGAPYHLLEGHHRLGYLRALVDDERWRAAPRHELWLVSAAPGHVLDYWPMNGTRSR